MPANGGAVENEWLARGVGMATVSKPVREANGTSVAKGDIALPGAPSVNETLDPDAPFMGDGHQAYFRAKLKAWRNEIGRDLANTREQLRAGPIQEPDATDRASSETDWSIELRRRDRQRKLISKIDAALRRIDEGEYGYCQVTGEPISLARLDARPIATMTVEAQESHERRERVTREL